mgnify:CR=1 FL=1
MIRLRGNVCGGGGLLLCETDAGADPDARYADILEREIYNGTISGMQLDGTKFFYINQLEANPGMPTNAYGEEEYTPERIGWYDCACCPPNLARLMTSLGSYVWSSK